MKKAGRPRKNGLQPIWVLQRETLALFAYERAREAGEKHSVAVGEAVRYVRENAPEMRISEAEVRRVLALWRSRRRATCVSVDKPNPERRTISLRRRDGKIIPVRSLYIASVAPRPTYPR